LKLLRFYLSITNTIESKKKKKCCTGSETSATDDLLRQRISREGLPIRNGALQKTSDTPQWSDWTERVNVLSLTIMPVAESLSLAFIVAVSAAEVREKEHLFQAVLEELHRHNRTSATYELLPASV
jgi:hypothetical protein